MARVLLVEDEAAMRQGLIDVLEARGHAVAAATRGDDGLALARGGGFDLVLLDGMLPGLSGFEVLKALRAAGDLTPVIMLTARNAELDRVLGFDLGVDDYVTKPFSMLELLGRIQAVLRRSSPPGVAGARALGRAEVDFAAFSLRRDGADVALPAKAFALLRALVDRPGQAVTRDQLIDAAWGADEAVNERTVNNLVLKLRQAIEPEPDAPRHLITVHGVGYRFDP